MTVDVASSLLEPFHIVNGIVSSLGFDNVESVAIIETTYSGTYTGEGTPAAATVPITEGEGYPPAVEQLSSEQLALTSYRPGSVRLGPITPPFEKNGVWYGTDPNLFRAEALGNGDLTHVRVTRRNGNVERYAVAKLDISDTTAFYVDLVPVGGDVSE